MMQLTKTLTDLAADTTSWKPRLFRLSVPNELAAFESLIEANRPAVTDDLVPNVRELVKSRNPTTVFTAEALHQAALDYLGEAPHHLYGVWVYYPWSNRVVHILDEAEFIEVRTNRNIYKITPAERDKLAQLKVGVIGLSVGQTISVTMAMERGFGEIRLADFDELELTNLNRIRAGLSSLGLKKAVIVAREIAELDPYLNVKVFTEGVTPENIHRFFTEGGNLDILVDECDGLDIKVLARHKCKELGIPLVQDMNDRGTLDVERFDLEPDRPFFHGTCDHLDLSPEKISGLTNEEKIPYLLPMIGIDTLSTRLHASMLEVGQTITTWPQLASSVILGGGLAADTCRRIALDQFHASGRWHIDLEELVCDDPAPVFEPFTPELVAPLAISAMERLANAAAEEVAEGQAVSNQQLNELVGAAVLAPTAGNMQPWKWLWRHNRLFLFRDPERAGGIGDYDNICSNIGLGAALENLVLKAHALGLEVCSKPFPLADNSALVAVVSFVETGSASTESHTQGGLANVLNKRCTNRNVSVREPIASEALHELKSTAATVPGARLQFLEVQPQIEAAAELIASAERLRVLLPEGHHDFFTRELRWTPAQAQQTRDGLDLRTVDVTESERIGLWVARQPDVMALLRDWQAGEAMKKVTRKVVQSAGAVGLLTLPNYSQRAFVEGGRLMQRVWLRATQLQLAFQPVSGSLFFFPRLNANEQDQLPADIAAQFRALRTDFEKLFETKPGEAEVFMFRLAQAPPPEVFSLRRPVEDVLFV